MVKRRMFGFITYTCNPLVGCLHNCIYCWARIQAKRQKHRCIKCYNFTPHTHLKRLYLFAPEFTGKFRKTPKNSVVFICSMSDLFGWWVDYNTILVIISFIENNPQTTFFLETKNPQRLYELHSTPLFRLPKNTIISTTIETNEYPKEGITLAPPPKDRMTYFWSIKHPNKHISIEPIMDFNLDIMVDWIRKINPKMVSMGYDNYGILRKHGIPEPSKEKYITLYKRLSKITHVEDKSGIINPSEGTATCQ